MFSLVMCLLESVSSGHMIFETGGKKNSSVEPAECAYRALVNVVVLECVGFGITLEEAR